MAVKVPPLLHKMSLASQKAWYKKHGMEMPSTPAAGGKSAAQAKKDVGEINKKKAREAAIAAAAATSKKNKELMKSSERVRQMAANVKAFGGQRPGGDLTTASGMVNFIRSGGYLKAGRLGEAAKPDASMAMTDTLKMKMISDKDKRTLGKVAALMASQKNKDKKNAYVRQLGLKAMKAGDVDPARGHSPTRFGREVLKKEEVEQIDEVTKKEAEQTLGGPVKEKPKMSPGKQPAGYRYVRGLARKAMKAGLKKEEVEVNEAIKDAADVGEYDYEGDMAKSQLRSILANAKRLHDMLEDQTNLPEWVQSKITLAEDYILTAANYMEGEMNEETLDALEAELVEEIELFEKAPPGSKYERMVKHIKKGYAKGGLTPQEKSIAYATAWKAYNKAKNEEVEQLSEGPSHYQYSGTIHSNVGNAKHGEEKDDGHSYSITIPTRGVHQGDLGSFLSSKKAFSRISRENPHLEPHHVLAVIHGTGDDVEDVEVDHKGKTYKHRLYNNQEPDYLYEEVEQIEEKYMGFKALKASIAAKGGVRDPAAVAAAIGRKKYGKEKFQAMAAAGKKANEEVVTEAEGKVAVTPKEKALAAHHGDKTKITYGDVIKARIKSAAEKAMKKGN